MRSYKKAYHTNCWGPLGGNAEGVTSITKLTYRTFGDMDRAIHDIAALGYDGVELFDGNLLDYEDAPVALRKVLADAGVQLVAAYCGANFIFPDILNEELARLRRVADAATASGALHLVVGGGARRGSGLQADDHERLAAGLEKVVALAKQRGLKAHYHPHLSTIVETPEQVRKIFSLTGIDFCPDTAHLAAAGGNLPEMIREHKARISYVHLKGWQKQPFAFTPLDQGDLDMAAIMKTLAEIDYKGWITTELDAWPDPKDGAARSLAFLRHAEALA